MPMFDQSGSSLRQQQTKRINEVHNIPPTLSGKEQSFLKGSKRIDFSTNVGQSEAQQQRYEAMKRALCEAIADNELLRDRVMELEALLAAAQEHNENAEERYISDLNKLQQNQQFQPNYPSEQQTRGRAKSL